MRRVAVQQQQSPTMTRYAHMYIITKFLSKIPVTLTKNFVLVGVVGAHLPLPLRSTPNDNNRGNDYDCDCYCWHHHQKFEDSEFFVELGGNEVEYFILVFTCTRSQTDRQTHAHTHANTHSQASRCRLHTVQSITKYKCYKNQKIYCMKYDMVHQ